VLIVDEEGGVMNSRELLRQAGVLSVAVVLAFCGSRSYAADPEPITVLVTYHSDTGNTEKMAQGVAEGAKAVPGTSVILKRVGEVAADDLSSSDAVIVGSPVYFGNMSGEVKTFFDNWTKFGLFRDRKMRNKVGGAFATGALVSSGKEVTVITILGAMLINQMIVVSGGGGFGASATTGPDSPGIDEKEMGEARDLGKRVAEVAAVVKRGSSKSP
jgi:NAD(P)H dehydrogenase (quinone)